MSKDTLTLPTLQDALREAQESLQRVGERGSLTEENIPETVRRIRAARAKQQMKLMEKERRFQERKLKAKQHYKVKRQKERDRRYGSLKAFYGRWRQHRSRDEGRMEFPYEDFCYIWNREAPYKTGDPLWVWSKRAKARCYPKSKEETYPSSRASP